MHMIQQGHKISRDKIQLFCLQVHYLRLDICPEGKTLSPEHIKTFLSYPIPEVKTQFQGFLELVATVGCGFLNFSAIASPLYSVTKERVSEPPPQDLPSSTASESLEISLSSAPLWGSQIILAILAIQECLVGTSLVVQWLRIRLPMQGTRLRSLVWEDATCRGATKPLCHNY